MNKYTASQRLAECKNRSGYYRRYSVPFDVEAVQFCKCRKCGQRMRYEGYKSRSGYYRAFAICTACDYIEEF